MQVALDAFQESMRRVREMHALHQTLVQMLTGAVDLSDMLRAEIVLAVSAFDFFIHELTRLGMLECHANSRPRTDAFKRFQVPMESALQLNHEVLDAEIRIKHGYLSFQHPDRVADAIRLFSGIELWNAVAAELGSTPKKLKLDLGLVIDRRNKIAHEADLDRPFLDSDGRSTASRWNTHAISSSVSHELHLMSLCERQTGALESFQR